MIDRHLTDKQKKRRKRFAEHDAAIYKTTPPLTLADAFTPRLTIVAGSTASGLPSRQTTPGAFGRDKLRMLREKATK